MRHRSNAWLRWTRGVMSASMIAMAACSDMRASPGAILGERTTPQPLVMATSDAELANTVSRQVERPEQDFRASPRERGELLALYQRGGIDQIWIDSNGRLTRHAHEALTILKQAASEGLEPADYDANELSVLADAIAGDGLGVPADLTRFEVGLSLGMLRYLRHLHLGRIDPRSIGFRLTVPVDDHDFAALLHSAVAEDRLHETIAALTPPLVQYRHLRAVLPRYRALVTDPTLGALPQSPATVHPGDRYAGTEQLRVLLVALGDMPSHAPASVDATQYEGPLVDGVKRFQIRHGLAADGVLGNATFAALRIPITWRVQQIELALERLRWVPHVGDRRFLALNIPMFRLWGWDSVPSDGSPSFETGVIVGRALSTQTPVFVDEMQHVIFHPYWNVPRSILRNELLPVIERDPGYLAREDMEIARGAGDDAVSVAATPENLALLRKGRLRLRQRPGPKNALGLVKFVFPNDANVYMHGTPSPALFSRVRRDFSHGCVRVENPVGLAEWALKDQPEWTRDRILLAMAGPTPRRVELTTPIQVILFYTTAVVMPQDGTVHFAEDIYRHDARLERALQERSRATPLVSDRAVPGSIPSTPR